MDRATQIFVAGLASVALSASAVTPESVPGEFIVKLKEPASFDKGQISALSQRLGWIKSTIPGQGLIVVKRPAFELARSVEKSIGADPMVEYIEPNYVYRASKMPNDPMLGQLWGMANSATAGMDVGAIDAWNIETGNPNLVIAVIDTGVNYNHEDLKENIWTNEAEANGKAGVDDDGNGVVDDIHGYNAITNSGDPLDDHGHGSHCSGTIAAKGDDGKGIVGVAWNAKIMGVKFLSADGSGTLEDAVKSIDYATRMGAKVLSNSWGGGGFSQALQDAITRSHQAGALFVAAAGNEANDNDSSPSYPASYDVPNVLSVAAIDNRGQLASFSNYGKNKVHVGAPGVGITSSVHNGGYATWSGTSMATPHVSGIAALLFSREPNLSAVEARERIITTSKRIASLRGRARAGMANAFTALTNVVPAPDMEDPANWQTYGVSISSKHPYDNGVTETYEVKVPGARQIAVHFNRFDTEAGYDIVTVKSAAGTVVDKISGRRDDSFSVAIDGDTAILEFKTDSSINKFGFEIVKAAWR